MIMQFVFRSINARGNRTVRRFLPVSAFCIPAFLSIKLIAAAGAILQPEINAPAIGQNICLAPKM
jgi:hypothetical protein